MTHLARHDPLTEPAEPGLLLDRRRARPADVAAPRHPPGAAVHRPRRLQAGQRPVRPRRRRRRAGRRRRSGCGAASARATRSPGSAVTSSRCCSRTSTRRGRAGVRADPRLPLAAAPTSPGTSCRCRASIGVAFGGPAPTTPRQHAAQRRPGDVRGEVARQEPVRRRTSPRSAAPALRAPRAASSRCAPRSRPATSRSSTSRSCAPPPAGSPASEALARWRSNGVPRLPDVFIRIAEETGLVVGSGRRRARRASPRTPPRLTGGGRRRVHHQRQHLRQAAARAGLRREASRTARGRHGRRRRWCWRSPSATASATTPSSRGRTEDRSPTAACRSPSTTSASGSPRSATCRTCRCRSSRPTCRSPRASTATSARARCCARSR